MISAGESRSRPKPTADSLMSGKIAMIEALVQETGSRIRFSFFDGSGQAR